MTDYQRYKLCKDFAFRAFEFLAPRITDLHRDIKLEVDFADFVSYTYANFRRPSWIYLHLSNLMRSCYGQNQLYSMIVIALTHELFHSEQSLIQEEYNMDYHYKTFIEGTDNKTTYDFLLNHRAEIRRWLGIELSLDYFKNPEIPMMPGYTRCNLEEYYHLLFLNVMLRSIKAYKSVADEILNIYPTIFVTFDRIHNFLIKKNGEYCRNTLPAFIRGVEENAAIYDYYTMSVRLDESFNRSHPQQVLTVVERLNGGIHPMAFAGTN